MLSSTGGVAVDREKFFQVSGLIRRRFFTEGALVRQGQPLYEIDPRLYRAAVGQAQANLQSARANAEATRIQAERYAPLAKIEAVSAQEYTNAIAAARQAAAQVAQTDAALETARVNLQFTTVPAPITGRIGRSLFTVGALVSSTRPIRSPRSSGSTQCSSTSSNPPPT